MCVGTNQIYSERQALQKQANQNAATQNQLARQYDQMLNGNRTFNGQAKQFDLKARNVTPTYSESRQLVGYSKPSASSGFYGIGEHNDNFTPRNSEMGQRLAQNQQNAAKRGNMTSTPIAGTKGRSGGSDPLLGYKPVYRTVKTQSGYVDATQNQMKNYLASQQKQINNLKTQISQVKQQNAAIEAAANSTKTLSSRHPELTFKQMGYSDKQVADKAAAAKGIKKPGGSRWWSQTILGKGDTSAPALSQRALLG